MKRNYLLALLLAALVSMAGPIGASGRSSSDRNSAAPSARWSVYAQGGISQAAGVSYENINARNTYGVSPAAGGGVDFSIRPWVRVGAEHLWTEYRRERRFSDLDSGVMPVQAYGNYIMTVNRTHLGIGLNPLGGKPRGFNIWAGTGFGYMFGKGNEYGIWFNSTVTQGGKTYPLSPDVVLGNESNLTVTGNVRATNNHVSFNSFYVPLSLHVEVDLGRQFAIGLKGGTDWLVGASGDAPRNLVHALMTLRFNFVPGVSKALRQYHGSVTR